MKAHRHLHHLVILIGLLLTAVAGAQGPLPPPGAPAPTMKTLQELWDKLSAQQAAVHAASRQNSLILSALGITLPWLFEDGPASSGPEIRVSSSCPSTRRQAVPWAETITVLASA